MSQRFLDRGQLVGYDFEKKQLIVTMSKKLADKMKADEWDVHYEEEIGHFIVVGQE